MLLTRPLPSGKKADGIYDIQPTTGRLELVTWTMDATKISLTLTTVNRKSYQLQGNPNLENWTDLSAGEEATAAQHQFRTTRNSNGKYFLRVKEAVPG